jgi:DNA repair exonuclease SbcCD ATPase subunit
MSDAFHIRRIRLIHFHNFVDETLPVRRNLFLVGDNQSGKSTVLDAVHFALTAGVDMEFNAAARFGPRSDAGRNLASIVLRYDLEKDIALRKPCVAYVAVEARDGDDATVHTFGVGIFATSLDAQPEVWGFIARGKGLDEVGLVVEEKGPEGEACHRPADRRELEESLGRDKVFDKGRYRTALAQFLYRDRDAYQRVMELITAAKSYRELVARARNLDDLFIGLLPPPAETEFREVRDALRAIDGIQADLDDLESELGFLRIILERLSDARRETEKINRYEYVGAELSRRKAYKDQEAATVALNEARRFTEVAEERLASAKSRESAVTDSLSTVRGGEGFALVERAAEARRELEGAESGRDSAREDRRQREADLQRSREAFEVAGRRLEEARRRAQGTVRDSSPAVANCDPEAAQALVAFSDALEGIEAGVPVDPTALQVTFGILRAALTDAALASGRDEALADGASRRLSDEAATKEREADVVRERAEVLPEIPQYEELLAVLQEKAPGAIPLYRLLELSPELPESAGSAFECFLGPRVLGAVAAPASSHAMARDAVLAHGYGVEVLDPEVLQGSFDCARPGTLPVFLVPVGNEEAGRLALSYLTRIVGDVTVLPPETDRDGRSRVFWTDGRMYDDGAEARIDPGPPRYLGEGARKTAAGVEEARLRREAATLRFEAGLAGKEAADRRSIAAACRSAREALDAEPPGLLLARKDHVDGAAIAVSAAEASLASSIASVEAMDARVIRCRDRYAELSAAVAAQGLAELRQRAEALEKDLESTRRDKEHAVDALGRCRVVLEDREKRLAGARSELAASEIEAERQRDVLRSLIEPIHRTDVDDYVFRLMRGTQINPSNIPGLVQEAHNARTKAFTIIQSSDGIRNERIYHRYGFRLDEEHREVRDHSGRPVEEAYAAREAEVRTLQAALDEKTQDLLERVVMAGLVRKLQGQVRDLEETIRGINRLAADLAFGQSRFQFSLKKRSEYSRLLELLREESILQPAVREELRDFFQARLDEFKRSREGDVPDVLDYRRWFEYVLLVSSRQDGEAAELPRQRLRFGSGGEQAVPTYLLVIAVASLLFNRTEARLRLLLLDEAFLGIDAGRREVLLQFADRAAVDFIVATPELDGVTPALQASTTLLIEKTPEQDVFVSDFHWQRPEAQASLFEKQPDVRPEDFVVGVRPKP